MVQLLYKSVFYSIRDSVSLAQYFLLAPRLRYFPYPTARINDTIRYSRRRLVTMMQLDLS